jgi:hypothetical protein
MTCTLIKIGEIPEPEESEPEVVEEGDSFVYHSQSGSQQMESNLGSEPA